VSQDQNPSTLRQPVPPPPGAAAAETAASVAAARGDAASGSRRLDLPGVEWRGISPRYLVAEFLGLVVTALILAAVTVPFHLFGWPFAPLLTVAAVGSVLLYAAFTPRRVRAIGYQLRADDLVFRRGILFQRFVAVPYGRMQLVDINRGPLSRALGLSDLKFVTAAAASGVAIPGLPETEAEELRDHLVAVAETRRAGL
jgi:membrane protein YdbS with pleckstrin-like domain